MPWRLKETKEKKERRNHTVFVIDTKVSFHLNEKIYLFTNSKLMNHRQFGDF